MARERSYVEEGVGRGPELLIPCGELREHLTPVREVAFIYVVKVQIGVQVTCYTCVRVSNRDALIVEVLIKII